MEDNNTTVQTQTKDALELAIENYSDYGKYVAQGRSYPCIKDGCKSVVKRAIYGMYKDGPRHIVKMAQLAAYALPYHPHPTSISGAIVQLGQNGNKLKLMKTQGNWGDSERGIQASADRYIGGMLSDLTLDLFCNSIEYCNYIDGEIDIPEPEALPALLPLCFINGVEGIPSGLPKINIPTLNIDEMFDYYIEIFKKKDLNYEPKKLPSPNIGNIILSKKEEWDNVLETGKGVIKVAPTMKIENGVITITALPKGKDSESVRKIIEKEILLDKIDLRDESTSETRIVIEKVKNKSCDMNEIFKRLNRKLQTSISYNMAFFDLDKIYVPCGFRKVVKQNIQYIIETHKNRISKQINDYQRKLDVLTTIELLKSGNHLNNLFSLEYDKAVEFISKLCNDEDIAKSVLQKPMSYLTKAHQKEITDLQDTISKLKDEDKDIYQFLQETYKEMKKKVAKEVQGRFAPTVFA